MKNERTLRRRIVTGASVLAIAATGAAWTGCGSDNSTSDAVKNATDQANKAAKDIQDSVSKATGDATKAAQDAANAAANGDSGDAAKAAADATKAATDAAAKATKDATDAVNQALDNAGQ